MLVEAWSLEKKPIGQGKKIKRGQDDVVVPLSTRAKGNDDAVRREKMDEEGEERKKGRAGRANGKRRRGKRRPSSLYYKMMLREKPD